MAGSFLYLFMAIYHLHAGFVSRSTGRSAVQAAAYISGTMLLETRRNLVANYSRTSNVEFSITLAPHAAPDFAKDLNVWDALENYEDSYAASRYKSEETLLKYKNSARIAQTIVIALPKELEPSVWKEIVMDFSKERFVSRGLVVSMAIHNDEGNPHAHFQISRRAIDENGQWSKTKDREITTRSSLIDTRKICAKIINQYLEREGLNERVDHRSFLDLGIPFEATRHEGWYARKLDINGRSSRLIVENMEIKEHNKQSLSLNPEIILQELMTKVTIFTHDRLTKVIQDRLRDDPKLSKEIYNQVSKELVTVGENFSGQMLYTTRQYMLQESTALTLLQNMLAANANLIIDVKDRNKILNEQYGYLFDEKYAEQLNGVKLLCGNSQLSVMVGRAGTGKTTTLKSVVAIHQQAKFKVVGMALAAVAADNLAAESGCTAETIAFYLDKWQSLDLARQKFETIHSDHEHALLQKTIKSLKQYELTSNHLLIIDEAGMVGTRDWTQILDRVTKSGAKCIKVGDDHQFAAIEDGDFFRKAIEISNEQSKLCSLTKIVRQKHEWMRQASQDLSEHRVYQALSLYEQHGNIKAISKDLLTTIAQAYVEQISVDPNGLLLTATNLECQQINQAVRTILKKQGVVASQDFGINGRQFALGDKIVFLKNDRLNNITTLEGKTLLIKNGTQGKIVDLQPVCDDYNKLIPNQYSVTVAIDQEGSLVKFFTSDYSNIDHGYALTLHKSQGKTVNWSMVVGSKYMDATAIYVALTRHRETTTLFYDLNVFRNFKELQQSLSRLATTDLVTDYSIKSEYLSFWENVQRYKLLGQDLMVAVKEPDWESYRDLKNTRDILGKDILANWKEHAKYAKQASLSKESIQIACGLKVRPLSLGEQVRSENIVKYRELAITARNLWNEIKQNGIKNCRIDPRYDEFNKLRDERNKLALEIHNNRPLYQEFVQQNFHQGINWKAINNHAQQFNDQLEKNSILTNNQVKTNHLSKEHEKQDNHVNIGMVQSDHRQQEPQSIVQSEKSSEIQVPIIAINAISNLMPENFIRSAKIKQSYKTYDKSDYLAIREQLNKNINYLATELLGEPKMKNYGEWRYGNKGSISVKVQGRERGLYANFEMGIFGGPVKLIADSLKLDDQSAFKWALNWLNYDRHDDVPNNIPVKFVKSKEWVTIFTVPLKAQNPDLTAANLKYQLLNYDRHETARFAYRDADQKLLFYTVRLENADGDKVVLPLTYCKNTDGREAWRWQGLSSKDRPLYGLDRLGSDPLKPVLIVEGEKTADAAQKLLPEFTVVSWMGGTGSVNKVDFSPVVGRNITLWPDNDVPGHQSMSKIAAKLLELHQASDKTLKLKTVTLPVDTPQKWDLADELPPNWNINTIKTLLSLDRSLQELPNNLAKTHIVENDSKAGNLILVNEVLQKYGLLKRYAGSKEILLKDVENIYRQLVVWNAFINPAISPHPQAFLEKAVLTAVLQQKVIDYERHGATLSQHISVQNVSLIAANIMQKSFNQKQHNDLDNILSRSQQLYKQQELQKSATIGKLFSIYPASSRMQLEILTDQMYLCKNMLNKEVQPDIRQKILATASEFEQLTIQGKISPILDDLIPKQAAKSLIETVAIQKTLEIKFMEQDRIQHLEQRAATFDRANLLTPEHMLIKARDFVHELHHEINHQNSLNAQLRQQQLDRQLRQPQRGINKDQELER